MLTTEPTRCCDVCKEVSGPAVVPLAVIVRKFTDAGDIIKEDSTDKLDYCPRCRKRLDTCIKTGTGPRVKGKDKTETEPANADA